MKRNLCMGCMQEKGDDPVCPHCGYEEGTPHFASYLPPHTMIDDRYLVGKVLSYNGESVVYIGYDTMSGRRVDVRSTSRTPWRPGTPTAAASGSTKDGKSSSRPTWGTIWR